MSWKKYFTPVAVDNNSGSYSPISGGGRPGPARSNYSSYLPDVYAGSPNRIEKYMQYDTMDMDSEVNAALDILAEFCTGKDNGNLSNFNFNFRGQPSSTETKLLKEAMQKWSKQQRFDNRMFRIVRNTFKYGDCFFLRDPETKKLLYIDNAKVSKIIVNESLGKIPEQYVIKDINFNFKDLVATTPHGTTNTSPSGTSSYTSGGGFARGMVGDAAQPTGTRFQNGQNEITVDAKHIVHISLSEGLDNNYPFGNSLLESVFKVYKQKELLEDAIIIYRIQRAPERRIFYVDVGNMPAHMAMSFVEKVKNEIQQRRIPSSTGGGTSVIDASYNPLSTNEDYFFPQTAEGRGSKVETLPGGTNLGEITDLKFFTNKLFRALRIPASYLPTSIDDQANTVSDGKVGTAYIQELRFNRYCERLQNIMAEAFDKEFKLWLDGNGYNIDASLFNINFQPPQNFAAYRQAELDTTRANIFSVVDAIPHLSKRFAMKRYLGLSQEEIAENEKLWREENAGNLQDPGDAGSELRSVGVTPTGMAADGAAEETEAPTEAPPADDVSGGETAETPAV
jgi:hypothetical protein